MSVDERRIAVIGTGKIGEALIKGLCASGWRQPSEIVATDVHSERLQAIKELCGVETSESNRDAKRRRADCDRRQAPRPAGALAGDRRSDFERADDSLGRGGCADRINREAPTRKRAGNSCDA